MKNLLLLTLLLSCLAGRSQVISGIYLGKLSDDSLRKKQSFELALNEYRGKIYGYSYASFEKNDTFYYSIREIRARREGNQLIVEDDKMIVNNFPHVDKKVFRTSVIPLNPAEDTLRSFNGSFFTNKTKVFYSVKGEVEASRDGDSSRSALIGHLRELNILGNDRGGRTETAVAKTREEKKPKKEEQTEVKKVKVENDEVKIKTETAKIKTEKKPARADQPVPPTIPAVVLLPHTARQNRIQQTVEVRSDSIILSFYDNGVIDGDSISVYLNGDNIIAKTKLLSTATRKTVAVPVGDVELRLVAENLGELPPNTGLLVIRDGDQIYNVNFSADLQTNASIILRRKK